jgi:predicted aconitase with swiveling domain
MTVHGGVLNAESEPIVAVGAIIGEIPMVDQLPIEILHSGDRVRSREQLLVWPA